ncbi:hypothetical protein P0Y35_03485 [Kiritimatiellaeota bacterium B1221]|nr:hypothetical protein [Kiritimatiellaeota bacterium B1221]
MIPENVATQRLQHLEKGKKRKPFLIIDFALRRGPVILLVGTLCSVLLMLLLIPKVNPLYEADGLLLIDPTKEVTLNGREKDQIPGDFGDWTRTQISRMTSEDVLVEAIRRTPVETLPDFLRENPDHPANPFRLMKRIKIQEIPRTYLIRLSIRSDEPDGIAEMLNRVMEVYLEKIEHEFESTYVRRKEYLQAERDKISSRLKIEEERLLALAETVPNKSFLHENYTVHLNKVEQLQRLYWEAFSASAETQAQLNKVKEDRKRISEMSLQSFADERVADNFGINRIEQWTYEQLQKMRAQIDGLTPENPDRVYVESRMKAMNEYLGIYKQRVNDETIKNLKEKQEYELETQEILAKSAAEAGKKRVEQLGKRLQEARDEAAKISMAIFQATEPTFARTQLRDRLQALDNRIDDTEMEAKAPLRVRIDKSASTPQEPTSTNAITLLLFAVVVGFGPIGAAVLVYEFADTRIRNTKEIELTLGGKGPDPINAYVQPLDKNDGFHRVTLDAPDHNVTHHIFQLASRMANDHNRFGGQSYVVVGLGRHCGTTSLSLNLAHALNTLCGKVLLLEISPLHPGLVKMIDCKQAKGIEQFLSSKIDESPLLVHDEERKIDCIFSEGQEPLIPLGRFPQLIDELKLQYDLILIDAGAYPEDISNHVINHADALLLVARYKHSYFADLRKAIDLATQTGVSAISAVLNFSEVPETPWLISAIQKTVVAISIRMDHFKSRLFSFRRKS